MRPDFIGIGAQKCASTWVYRILQDHPQVGVSDPKELDFFSYYFNFGYQWYLNHFTQFPDDVVCGEISPSYFTEQFAAERALSLNPEIKVIVTIRDPVQRAYSNHLHEIRLGHFSGDDLTFEAGLKNNPMYLEQSKYGKYLARWMDCIQDSKILVLLQEEIIKDPVKESKRVYDFLGIDRDHESAFLYRKANVSYAVKSKALERSIKFAGWAARKIGLQRFIEAVKNNNRIVGLREKNRVHLGENVPEIKNETREQLIDMLSVDIEKLVQLIGRESMPWETWEDLKQLARGKG